MKKTLVLGASENPARYSFEAVTRLRKHGHEVVAVGRKSAVVAGVQIETVPPAVHAIDTVTLYLNPTAQKPYYDYIVGLKPQRIIFNPGTENDELEAIAQQNGIKTIEACTLVMLSTGQY
jgi:predicted CoA-binding protein